MRCPSSTVRWRERDSTFLPSSAFCSVQASPDWMRPTHWGGHSVLLSPLIHMLTASGNTLTDTPTIAFSIYLGTCGQSGGHIEVTITRDNLREVHSSVKDNQDSVLQRKDPSLRSHSRKRAKLCLGPKCVYFPKPTSQRRSEVHEIL